MPCYSRAFSNDSAEGFSMLKTMRNSFHHLKWTLFLVIAVFILGFVFWSGSSSDPNRGSEIVARVGNERITAVEFDRQYRAQVERYRQMYQGNFSPELERALDLPRNVLDSMIERMLRLEAAKRLDLHVSDEELAQKIVTLPFFQENNQFIGREKYEKMLRSNGVLPDRFEGELREDLLLEKYAGLVKASVVVPDTDLAREFAARNDKATIEYVLIPAARLDSKAQPTDADLQAYLAKHQDRYRAPVQRKIKYLLIDRGRVRARMTPTDAELRAAYEQKKDTFSVPEQVNASHILVAVKEGDPNADAAARAKAEILAARAKQPGADF
ncbi:MAG TPA: SurA N-terminal domain-containing protein, partial [Thermoanaerobaculia bacterium]|nr:SurA N-terminal domain-containing protein [Thermoanaerobaculia bacterium]